MNVKPISPALALLAVLSACSSPEDIGGGFAIIDGGGSKQSLTRDGFVLINYTVTGLGRVGEYVVVENRDYGSAACKYYVIDTKNRDLISLDSDLVRPAQITLRQAVQSVEIINQRSCKASPPADE